MSWALLHIGRGIGPAGRQSVRVRAPPLLSPSCGALRAGRTCPSDYVTYQLNLPCTRPGREDEDPLGNAGASLLGPLWGYSKMGAVGLTAPKKLVSPNGPSQETLAAGAAVAARAAAQRV